MRTIDADALRDEIETWGCNDYDKYDFLEAIDNAPTVENVTIFRGCDNCELERPQGEWVPYTDPEELAAGHDLYAEGLKCSACNYKKMKFSGPSNFCPNCGASMRRQKNETF